MCHEACQTQHVKSKYVVQGRVNPPLCPQWVPPCAFTDKCSSSAGFEDISLETVLILPGRIVKVPMQQDPHPSPVMIY